MLDIVPAATAAYEEFLRRPSAKYAGIATVLQGLIAIPLGFLLGPVVAWAYGAGAAVFFLAGREVERAAPHWAPGQRVAVSWAAARRVAWPAAACGTAWLIIRAFNG